MSNPDPTSEALGDWRLHMPFWGTQIGTTVLDQPLPGRQMTSTESPCLVTSFQTPSSAALHPNAAWKAAKRASAGRGAIKWVESPTVFVDWGYGSSKATRQVPEDAIGALFDYLEDVMVAAGASYSAIEAFCNSTIAERLSGTLDLQRRGGTRTMTAEEIEEKATTEEKLKRVVPMLLGAASPAGDSMLWQAFKRLKSLRDSITTSNGAI